ncbi:MAG: PQQ-binding-like beta-propeller repeat protein [Caldisericia bacterium]|nr:PQQ-binding-like beta-propeller repeat protein [Caldisericia bacterium]
MFYRFCRFILLITIIFVSSSVNAVSDEWFTYRHDNTRSAKSSIDMPPPFLKIRAYPVGEAVNHEPVIKNGYAYIGTGSISCLNLSNGVTEWSVPVESKVSTTPLALDDRVIVGTEIGNVICLDSTTSRQNWQLTGLGKIVDGFCHEKGTLFFTTTHGFVCAVTESGQINFKYQNKYPFSCAPSLSEGKLIVGDDKGIIQCMDTKSSKILWKNDTSATDIVGGFSISNNKIFFGSFDNHVYCLELATGKLIWQKRVDGWVQSPPLIIDNIAYFQIRHTRLIGYTIDNGEYFNEYEYQPSKSETIASGNTILLGSNRRIEAINSQNLEQSWYYEFVDEQVASISMGSGYLLIGTSLGRIYQFKTGPVLGLSTKNIDIDIIKGSPDKSFSFAITNLRQDKWMTSLEGDVSASSNWLYVEEPLFKLTNNKAVEIKVLVFAQNLGNPGTYNDELTISSNGGYAKIPIIVRFIDPNPPKACFDKNAIDMGAMQVGTYKKTTLQVTNCGKSKLKIDIEIHSLGDWLVSSRKSAEIAENKSEDIILTAKGDNLTATKGEDCTYNAVVLISTNADQEPISIPVSVRCYGIPIPTTINIQIGSPTVRINSDILEFNPPSYISKSRTMVPLRLIGEAFFANVEWIADARTIMISSCTQQARFVIGSDIVELITNEGIVEKQIDVPPELVNGRTFIPIRAVSDILGGKTAWEPTTKTVTITYEP